MAGEGAAAPASSRPAQRDGQKALVSRGRGRGGGRGRGREEPVTPQYISDGKFKVADSSQFLSDRYQKALESKTTVTYRRQERAWGGSAPMLQDTTPDAFAKLVADATDAYSKAVKS